tara:strand:- start:180 stop:1613 length:1434 start_codon:yes stop_codon:yes gene_type:complete
MAEASEIQKEFETVKAPTLPTSQQEVAEQSFESAVSPLRREFGERLKGTTETLASKGIAFGGLGGSGLRDVFKEQQRIEGGISRDIGVRLGETSLDQAFRASEAAKSRTLQKELQSSGFEFQAGESERGREFVGGESEKGRGFAGGQAEEERGLRRELSAAGFEESAKGREFVGGEAEKQRVFQAEQSAFGRSFTSEEANIQRDFNLTVQEASNKFQAEQALFGRTFTAEESQRQRTFQEAFQTNREEFQANQTDIDRQNAKNEGAIRLALSGNLEGDAVQALIEDTFGEGVSFTDQDEADMQRIAAASGLSVEDYTKIRSTIGQGQLMDVLENPGDYISSPGAMRDFQLHLAKLENEAKVNVAKEEGSKVLCTELHAQGLLPDDIYEADAEYAKRIPLKVVRGYHFWGKPLASKMKGSEVVTTVLNPFITAWAYHMAYKMGVTKKRCLFGNLLEIVGVPICYLIGSLIGERRATNA